MRSYDVLNSMSDEADDIMSFGQITTETKGAPAGGKPDLIPQDYVGSGIRDD